MRKLISIMALTLITYLTLINLFSSNTMAMCCRCKKDNKNVSHSTVVINYTINAPLVISVQQTTNNDSQTPIDPAIDLLHPTYHNQTISLTQNKCLPITSNYKIIDTFVPGKFYEVPKNFCIFHDDELESSDKVFIISKLHGVTPYDTLNPNKKII